MQSGQARNVISSRTYIEGSLRTYSDTMTARAKAELSRLAHERALEAGCTCEVDFSEGYPPVVNDAALFEQAREALTCLETLPEPLLIASCGPRRLQGPRAYGIAGAARASRRLRRRKAARARAREGGGRRPWAETRGETPHGDGE